ncbi:PAS domain S-box protein [Paucibacter sp. Y2R2-4]|uniref:bifunctional diguanylate cyclase/phosphodiesterase n=1 Tax=Paucibacter sp. Y2R2-4 TaxID=2893553 RepID=UPI0021E477A8|nr:PAS domain S-box protein [Paucibacter sp. Y2R2-4]MCV2348699.1 PAS domain S-box protein [Paucibacter sp. Y2R2-4]
MMPKRVFRRLSIRQRIFLLALVAFLPAALLLVGTLLADLQRSEAAAQDRLRLMADDVAGGLENTLQRAQAQLTRIAARPQVRALDPTNCDPVIANYAQINTEFSTLVVRDLEGQVVCSYLPRAAPSLPQANAAWFKEALAKDGFAMSGAVLGQISGRWISSLSMPIYGDSGKRAGLLRIALDLLQVNEELMAGQPRHALITVVDQKGKVLLRSEDLAQHVGKPLSPSVLLPAEAAGYGAGLASNEAASAPRGLSSSSYSMQAAGYFHAQDQVGLSRVFYSRPVAGGEWRLFVGLPVDELFAEHRSRLQRSVLLCGLALGLALALALQLGRSIIRPLVAMSKALDAEAGKQGVVPAELAHWGEIERVGFLLQQVLEARRDADAALRDSEASYRVLVEHSPDLIASIDSAGRFTFVNSATEEVFGLPAKDCIGQSALSFAHADDREPMLQALRAWLDAGAATGLRWENRQVGRHGRVHWLQWHISALRDASGHVQSLSCIGRDVSAVREQQRLLNDTQAIAHIGSWRLDVRSGERTWSSETYKLYGIEPGSPLPSAFGQEYQSLLHVDDWEAVQSWFAVCLSGRDPGGIEFRVRTEGGVSRWLLGYGALERSADGEPLSLYGTVQDISERKLAEERLRQAQNFSAAVIDALTEHIAVLDAHGVIMSVNRGWEEFARQNGSATLATSSIGINYLEVCREADHHLQADEALPALRGIEDVLAGRRTEFSMDYPCHSPSQKRWFRMRAFTLKQQGGGAVVSHEDISARWLAEEALAQSEASFKSAFECSAIGMALVSTEGSWLRVNAKLCQMFGYAEAEMMSLDFKRLSLPEDLDLDLREMRRTLRGEIDSYVMTKRYFHKDGHVLWGLLSVAGVKDPAGHVLHLVTQLNDISEQKKAEQQLLAGRAKLRESAQHTQAILDHMKDGVISIDASGLILSFSRAAGEMFGYAAEELIGRSFSVLMPEPQHSLQGEQLVAYIRDEAPHVVGRSCELEGLRKDGSLFPVLLSVSELATEGQDTFMGLVRDLSSQHQHQEEMHRLAFYDPLTGLPNRRLLLDRLAQVLQNSGRSGEHSALLLLDLDHFKLLNDSLGHETGDQLLQQVAERLRAQVRDGDIISRFGGDEFVVLLEALGSNSEEAAKAAESVADKLLQILAQPYALRGQEHVCTPSIGIVVFKGEAESRQELLKKADVAMYQAKSGGRNRACFYDPVLQASVAMRQSLAHDMRRGLAAQEFTLYYQVQVNALGEPDGVEALVRWRHPTHGLMSPLFFIPLAEETGLILPLGQWVLETACAQLRNWADDPMTAPWTMAVNVSASQLTQDDFVESVASALRRTGASPYQLKLELTESMLIHDVEDVITKMRAVKALGVGFSLDDFGTGYSSLSILKRLPLDQLKIDQSFVRDLLTDLNDVVIARTVLALGQSLGLKVIAEGVENAGQLEVLSTMGCQAFQGYYFGRPVPAQELPAKDDSQTKPSN